ncbi:MAG: hypothetical protein FWE43_04790, partial [Streptococcaceae bacterium]|nr:hypothetical protein [Streptococcaceae bacterium]
MTNWITKLVSPDTRFEETTAYMLMGSNIVREAVEIGFKEIPISLSLDAYFANAPDKRAAVIASLLDPVKPGDTVFVQFPFFMHINFQAEFFSYIKENRKAKAVAIVHDVMEYMSGRTDYNVDNSFELSWLANKFDLIIAHNEKFAKRLKDDEINLPMVSLHLFDYPHDAPLKEKRFKRQIYYPSGRYADHIDYNGKTTLKIISKFEYDFSDRPNIEAIDSMTSKEILTYMDGGFGLVNSNNISENQFPAQRE